MTLPSDYYKSSPLWFVVGGTKTHTLKQDEHRDLRPQERVVLLCVCDIVQG
jgi:hypothetical protein